MGSYVISVSAGTGCYRHIQISKTATLHRLHKAIIAAFDFEDDHEHAFFIIGTKYRDVLYQNTPIYRQNHPSTIEWE